MNKKVWALGLAGMMMFGVAACGAKEEAKPATAATTSSQSKGMSENNSSKNTVNATNEMRTIHYLGKEYSVPVKAEKIVITGSVESMEDALVLDVKPVGAMTTGGRFAPLFAKIIEGAEGVGEKTQPNMETILKLKPDVILASTKFPAETVEKLNKIATTIPVSHISTNWESNLNLLAELTGKQEQARQALQKYNEEVHGLKEKIGVVFKDKNVLVMRVRAGSIMIYPENVFFNPSVYSDLGAMVPKEVKQAKAQQVISLEKLSEMNPDYLFVQFSEAENKDTPKVLEDLQKNPIWKSINAVKNDNVFVNLVDPTLQGGTVYSKIAFLEAIKSSKLVQTK
ncbi:ABC transporter substrate-binding protein [Aneurinibacillus thermoaerophilus]|uniref:ABC transporter substrate-binding protein n=1 Tax=Aneurinibacillus thermoaerophilus TaxID=143495 RepID=A0A1G7Y1C2_ANETH|nr:MULTISPECIES: ABC transporter substrate-binding protein [Aneurinibacillus]AMA72970.1 iron-uptake system-binding protein [Aneurinibacillus sp. XH2]MED0675913.1 ABC transporter substrate-binding protein [Aneurinibacillus thermoaerophilus]MED0758132.1 ABC transporter substrate-binding protein [Aneurinibacillus thermoaerophilus]MED0761286.1 ABC transporter substrate-binding protein [Aneurinibacillus thermoaerophilus]QYY41316.1 ABC transporter substrate-binding protein [Aneurinibacillus thermoae